MHSWLIVTSDAMKHGTTQLRTDSYTIVIVIAVTIIII
jgi:hypothetical protein